MSVAITHRQTRLLKEALDLLVPRRGELSVQEQLILARAEGVLLALDSDFTAKDGPPTVRTGAV